MRLLQIKSINFASALKCFSSLKKYWKYPQELLCLLSLTDFHMKYVQIIGKTIYLLPDWCMQSSYAFYITILKVHEVKLGHAGKNVKFHCQHGVSSIFCSWRKERNKHSLPSSVICCHDISIWMTEQIILSFLCATKISGKCVINRARQVSSGCRKDRQSIVPCLLA